MNKLKTIEPNIPKVVLLGRTNVGKSTLFNKISEKYKALVSSEPGTTRDINMSIVNWQGVEFELIDTGGLTSIHLQGYKKQDTRNKQDELDSKIVKKAIAAVKRADLIVWLVDAKHGLLKEDKDIATWLKKRNYHVILAANKADNNKLRQSISEFYKLGFGEPVAISASSGSGVGDLLDKIISHIRPISHIKQQPTSTFISPNLLSSTSINVAIIGRPNVGKSSLLNKLLGEERVIVSDQPHTTREPIDTEVHYNNHNITLIDTAGIRKKSKIKLKSVEKKGVALSLKAMARADVVLLMFDLAGDLGQQDLKLAQEILKARVGIIIVANKLDILDKDILRESALSQRQSALEDAVLKNFNFIKWAPVVLISALTGKNVNKIYDLVLEVQNNRSKIVDDEELADLISKLSAKQPPPKKRNALTRPKVLGLKQISSAPPHFEVIYKGKGILPLTYLKYIEKGLREKFEFSGTPIIIHQRKI